MNRRELNELVTPICERLGLDVNDVCELRLQPHRVEATVFVRHAGRKYLDEHGEPARQRISVDLDPRS